MSTFFAFLFVISLCFLIAGLIAPHKLSKAGKKPLTRRDAAIGFGFFTFVFMVLTSITAPKASIAPKVDKPAVVSQIKQTTTAPKKHVPVVTTQTTTETAPVPFTSTTVSSNSMPKGTSKVTTVGINGVLTFTYSITLTDGKQTDKKLVSQETTTQPVTQVNTVGTYVAPTPVAQAPPKQNCDPNYTGACVPNVYPSDVDCGGGSGNGPYYVYGTVRVVGVDRYDLDGDGNGYGCQ